MAKERGPVVMLSTVGTEEKARSLARSLVERNLAACVNILPGATSIYRWKGEVEEASECVLVIKTTNDNLPAIESLYRTEHPYELPELIELKISAGKREYLDWILAGD